MPAQPSAATTDESRVLMEWDAGRDLMRVTLGSYNGKARIDVRRYFDSEGTWKPTQKGAIIPLELVPELIEKLTKVLDD